MDKSFQNISFHQFDIYIDNKLEAKGINNHPEQFKYVFVYFGDKYYPASTAHVRNFYACQGNKTTISQPEHFFLVLTCKSKSSCGFGVSHFLNLLCECHLLFITFVKNYY